MPLALRRHRRKRRVRVAHRAQLEIDTSERIAAERREDIRRADEKRAAQKRSEEFAEKLAAKINATESRADERRTADRIAVDKLATQRLAAIKRGEAHAKKFRAKSYSAEMPALAVPNTLAPAMDTNNLMNNHVELALDESAQKCLALAYLRLMNFDIAASSSSEKLNKIKDRNAFVGVLGGIVPESGRIYSPAAGGPLSESLKESCLTISGTTQAALILSELALFHPWKSEKVHPESRRIALKELAHSLEVPESDLMVDYILDELVPKPHNVKKIVFVTLATAAGGLIAAPHIGAAIGVYALGLTGAAATSAGLAALGFGSVAAGGFGMAGGTLIVGALTGAVGGGTSLLASASNVKSNIELESIKLQISLNIMLILPRAASEANKIIETINQHLSKLVVEINYLASERLVEGLKSKDEKNKALLKNMDNRLKTLRSEEKILRMSLPLRARN